MSSQVRSSDGLRAAIRKLRYDLAQGTIRFPVLDPKVAELNALFARAEVTVDETSELVVRDPALAASVLRAANSAFYKRGNVETTSPRDACIRLGTRRVLAIALEAATHRTFETPSKRYADTMTRMWEASVVSSRLAARLAARLRRLDADEIQVGALFHNAGETLLVQLVAALPDAERFTDEEVAHLVERLHEDFGRSLCQAWGLPRVYVTLAGHHHRPATSPEPPEQRVPRLLVLAGWKLARRAGYTYFPEQDAVDAEAELADLGLARDEGEALADEARTWEV